METLVAHNPHVNSVLEMDKTPAEFKEPDTLESLRAEKELADELLGEFLEKAEIKRGSRILDFGCGTGSLIRKHLIPLAEKTGCSVFGMDPSQAFINFANEQTKNAEVNYICSRLEHFTETGFDLIISTYVLEYFANPENVLADLYKLLKPGGKLWIATTADVKLFHYFKAVNQHPELGKYCQNLPVPNWVEKDACQEFYEEQLKLVQFQKVELKTFPGFGFEYDSIQNYVDFFMWVGVGGATDAPKSLEPEARELIKQLVESWVETKNNSISMEWKTLVFTAQK